VHAKSTGELISFGFSDHSVQNLDSANRSANRRVQTKNDFNFQLIFGLSPNLGLSEMSHQKNNPKSEMTQSLWKLALNNH